MGDVTTTVPRLEINEAIRQRLEFLRILRRDARVAQPCVRAWLLKVIDGGVGRITYIRNLRDAGATHFP